MKTKLILLVFTLVCANSLFASDIYLDGLYYSLNPTNMTAMVTSNKWATCHRGKLVIPSTITYENRTYTVTEIDGWTFLDCTELTSVTIPASICSVGDKAFANCSNLQRIYCYVMTPPVVDDQPFHDVCHPCTIYVPIGKIPDYQKAYSWSRYLSWREFKPSKRN